MSSAVTIAIEGSDGAGKATQTELLAKHLISQGFKVARVSFPRYNETRGGTLLFEFLKSPGAAEYDFVNTHPKLASHIYAQDRFESLGYLKDLIEQNDFVIFDRYVESNLLHQGGKLKGEQERVDFAEWLYALEYDKLGLPKPKIIIYLDLPYTISRARALKRAEEKGEKLDAVEENNEYVRNGWESGRLYAKILNWNVVNCIVPDEKDELVAVCELNPEEIHLKLREIVDNRK